MTIRSNALALALALALLAATAPAADAQTTTHHAASHTAPKPCPPVAPDPVAPANIPAVAGSVRNAFTLRYVDVQAGTGDLVAPGEYITVHYTGWLASDGTKFDSSVDRGQPFTFPQGAHRVIAGWDLGFAGMRVGGKRRLFIPYQLAYGEEGRAPIPPKSDLIFDVELVAAGAMPPDLSPAAQPPAKP